MNHIASIKNEVGEWITKEGDVMDYFRKGFISLYTTSQMMVPRKPIQNLCRIGGALGCPAGA